MNDAGVGVLLAILSHVDDQPGGVPIHSVLHRILAEATTVDAAADRGRAWQTLATIAIDEAGLTILDGSPLDTAGTSLRVPPR